MATNADLIPNQNAGTTSNPQAVDTSVGASDSNSFQNSAGIETLNQNRPLSVAQTGKPVESSTASSNNTALMWVFVVVASVVLVMIATSVFKWVMKRPEPVKPEKAAKAEAKPASSSKTTEAKAVKVVRPKGKKKQPRSKRHK